MRTDLYEPVDTNILLDDFILSMNICKKGFRVMYEPAAFAMEAPSISIKEEQKRKVTKRENIAFSILLVLKWFDL